MLSIRGVFLFCSIFLVASTLDAQENRRQPYRVLLLRGEVVNLTEAELLRRESSFYSRDALLFKSKSDKMIAADLRGRSYLVTKGNDIVRPEWRALDLPLGRRGKKAPGTYAELQAYFSDSLAILGDTLYTTIPTDLFPLNPQTDFYIQYDWTGDSQAPVAKLLRKDSAGIYIERQSLYRVDGVPIAINEASNYALYYYDHRAEKSVFINHFTPIFVADSELKPVADVLLARWSDKDASLRDSIVSRLQTIVENFYGPVDKKEVVAWVDTHLFRL